MEQATLADCHIHMVLDGAYYKTAIAAHAKQPRKDLIRGVLASYQALGFTYLRDGGDRWGVGLKAREIAPEYGITYRSPGFPIYKKGHYGAFIGRGFEDLTEYRQRITEARALGCDFIKVMISGLMDFDRCGVLTEDGLSSEEIRNMVHIAHEEGFALMAHANGSRIVAAAAEAGADSVEHGAYLNKEALAAMAEAGTVWVPTLSTIGNLRSTGRFIETEVRNILETAMENVEKFHQMGGILAPGSDAGAFAVPHGKGGLSEYALLREVLGKETDAALEQGITAIRKKF